MRWPWDRWREVESQAAAAELAAEKAQLEHAEIRRVAESSRQVRAANGFTDAIRQAMGVTK